MVEEWKNHSCYLVNISARQSTVRRQAQGSSQRVENSDAAQSSAKQAARKQEGRVCGIGCAQAQKADLYCIAVHLTPAMMLSIMTKKSLHNL